MIGILGEHQYLLNINVHIIDYIGLCMYTSTCLYIILICMFIHIYIYTHTIYIYVHVCLVYSCMQHPQHMISYKARKSFSPKNCLRDVVCPGLRSPSALCKPPTLPLPHQQFQADALISCPRSYEWVQFLQKGFNHFYRFFSSKPRRKKTPSLKYELHPAKHPIHGAMTYWYSPNPVFFPSLRRDIDLSPIYHLFTTKSGGAWKFSSSSFAEPCKQFAFPKKSSKNAGLQQGPARVYIYIHVIWSWISFRCSTSASSPSSRIERDPLFDRYWTVNNFCMEQTLGH